MSLFDIIFRSKPSWPVDDDRWYRMPFSVYGGTTSAGIPVDESNALTYSAVWCAQMLISGTIASLPLHLKRTTKSGVIENITDHNMYDLLHTSPNSEMTAFAFRETGELHKLSWGNWYANIVRNNRNQIVALWPIPPNRVTVKRDEKKNIINEIMVNSEKVILQHEEVLHIPGAGFDGLMGYSVITYARQSIGLGLACEQFGSRFFGADTHPGLVISHPTTLSPEAHSNLRNDLEDKHAGIGKSLRLMLLDEGMKIEKLGIPPEDSQFLETRIHQIDDIARWYNVPPHKLKEMTKSSFSNIEQEQISWVVDSIRPRLVRIEQNYNMQLLTPEERKSGLFFKHSVEGLLRGDTTTRGAFYREMVNAGIYSRNECRALEDMNPLPGADELLVPLNMLPASYLDEWGKKNTEEAPVKEVKVPAEPAEPAKPAKKKDTSKEDKSLISAYRPIFHDAWQRIINRQVIASNRKIKQVNSSDFQQWLVEFNTKELPDIIIRTLTPIIRSFALLFHSATFNADEYIARVTQRYITYFTIKYTIGNLTALTNELADLMSGNELDSLYKEITGE